MILILIFILAFAIVVPVGSLLAIALCKNWDGYLGDVARAGDLFCNVLFQHGLNFLMLTKGAKHKFGIVGEYISTVYADEYKNDIEGLTKIGMWFSKRLIDFNDPAFKK